MALYNKSQPNCSYRPRGNPIDALASWVYGPSAATPDTETLHDCTPRSVICLLTVKCGDPEPPSRTYGLDSSLPVG